jgi:hypothetical protein
LKIKFSEKTFLRDDENAKIPVVPDEFATTLFVSLKERLRAGSKIISRDPTNTLITFIQGYILVWIEQFVGERLLIIYRRKRRGFEHTALPDNCGYTRCFVRWDRNSVDVF